MRLFGLTQRQDTAAREKKAREPREGKQQPGRCSPGKQGWGTRQDAPARTGKQDRAPQRQDTTPGSQTRYRHNLKDTRTVRCERERVRSFLLAALLREKGR